MSFVAFMQRYSILFNLCGIGEFSTHARVSSTLQAKFTENLLAIFHLLIVIVLYYFAIYFRISSPWTFSTFNNVLAYTHISCELLLHLTISGQAIMYRGKFNELARSYDFIHKYMTKRLKFGVHLEGFGRRLNRVIFVLVFPCLVALIWRATMPLLNIRMPFNIIILTFYFMSTIVELHIIAHVELLKFFLNTTRHWLCTRTSEFSAINLYQPNTQTTNGYRGILHLKWIHFKLWEITTDINRIFGWSLGAMIIRNGIEIAYGAYWVYFYVGAQNYMGLIRKILIQKVTQHFQRCNVHLHTLYGVCNTLSMYCSICVMLQIATNPKVLLAAKLIYVDVASTAPALIRVLYAL